MNISEKKIIINKRISWDLPSMQCDWSHQVHEASESENAGCLPHATLTHTPEICFCTHTHMCSERLRPTLSWAHKRWDHWTETWRMPPNQTSELWAHALLSLNNREKSQSYSREDDKTTNRICHHPKCQGTTWNQPTWLLRWTRDHWF